MRLNIILHIFSSCSQHIPKYYTLKFHLTPSTMSCLGYYHSTGLSTEVLSEVDAPAKSPLSHDSMAIKPKNPVGALSDFGFFAGPSEVVDEGNEKFKIDDARTKLKRLYPKI